MPITIRWSTRAVGVFVCRLKEGLHLLLNSGQIVVSTTNAIGLADATAVQALIPDAPLVLVQVGDGEGSARAHDLLVRGDEPAAEVIAKIAALLDARGITKI